MYHFFAVCDNEGMYTDDRCIFYDRKQKKHEYLCYRPEFRKYVLLGETYGVAEIMMGNVEKLCKKHKVHREFHIEDVIL
jgi:hypothetical protein